jgi:hypothetical protein
MSLSVLILYFFLNTYNTVAIATSWSVAPIETTSEMIPLNVSLATSKTSLFPPPRRRSFHLQDIDLATSKSVSPIATTSELIPLNVALATSKTSLLPPPRRLSCHLQDVSLATSHLLPPPRRRSCHLQDVSLSTSKTSLLPHPRRCSCHIQDVSLATSKTTVLRRLYGVWTVKSKMTHVCMKRRNKDKIYVVGKVTSCEMTFEGVRCLSFSRQYKVAIASNAPSKFDPNVLVEASSRPLCPHSHFFHIITYVKLCLIFHLSMYPIAT